LASAFEIIFIIIAFAAFVGIVLTISKFGKNSIYTFLRRFFILLVLLISPLSYNINWNSGWEITIFVIAFCLLFLVHIVELFAYKETKRGTISPANQRTIYTLIIFFALAIFTFLMTINLNPAIYFTYAIAVIIVQLVFAFIKFIHIKRFAEAQQIYSKKLRAIGCIRIAVSVWGFLNGFLFVTFIFCNVATNLNGLFDALWVMWLLSFVFETGLSIYVEFILLSVEKDRFSGVFAEEDQDDISESGETGDTLPLLRDPTGKKGAIN